MIEQGIVKAIHRAQARDDEKGIEQAKGLLSHYVALKGDGFQDPPVELTETQPKRETFSEAEKKALKREGLVVYPLVGLSIQDQKNAGQQFWYIIDAGEKFLTMSSRATEVAFNPDPKKFYLPGSNNKTLDQQIAMIQEYSDDLQKRLKLQSAEAIMGEAPDYVELIFTHFDATNKRERLFGQKYGFNYARTKTPTVGSFVADVGDFIVDSGPCVCDLRRGNGNDDVFAVPLVVPK